MEYLTGILISVAKEYALLMPHGRKNDNIFEINVSYYGRYARRAAA